MSLLYRVIYATHANGTHHKLAMLFNPMKAPKHLRAKQPQPLDVPEEEEAPAAA